MIINGQRGVPGQILIRNDNDEWQWTWPPRRLSYGERIFLGCIVMLVATLLTAAAVLLASA